jgi:hypothetical protein
MAEALDIDFGADAPGVYVPPIAVDLPPAEFPVETWHEFSAKAGEHVPTLVEGLWPEDALGFIAAPPKKGKTWIALALGISIATGRPYLGRFRIPEPHPVLYVALEGHRAALRSRVGAISRGLGLDPDGADLDRLSWSYKPRGINIADAEWARALRRAAEQLGAKLIVVDVLRAAARMKENPSEEFLMLRHNLLPVMHDGCSVALLHHFGKLTEITKERSPGERMSGSGAMYGAMDIGLFITGSENGAKNLRLEIESRDLATPERLGVHLRGEGTGEHGGWTYNDRLTFDCDDDTPDERDLKAPAEEIRDYVIAQGGDVECKYIRAYFEIADMTLTRRLGKLMQLGIDYVGGRGKPSRLVVHRETTSLVPPHEGTRELTNFPAQQSQNGPSSTKFTNEAMWNSESGDLQGFSSSLVPPSPTESRTAAAELSETGENDALEHQALAAAHDHDPWFG